MREIEPRDIMRYYVTYFDIEKQILRDINSNDGKIKNDAYHIYVNKHMKIGRNFKPKSGEMVLLTISNMFFNEGNLGVDELSDRYVRNELVSRPAIKNVKVASSKLLWLFDQNTIIMDSNNMKVLKAKNYADYVKKWISAFEKKQIEIDKILNTHFKNLEKFTDEKWFKMRVFDQYLLSVYSEQKKYKKQHTTLAKTHG